MNLQFTPSYDLIIIVSLFSIFTLYFFFKRSYKLERGFILIILRSLILFFLMLLLFDPTFEKTGNIKKTLPWHIYVDKSLSLKYHKQPSAISYKNGIQVFLNKIEDRDIEYEIFSFGSKLDSIKNVSEIELNANSTNLGLIFDKIDTDYQKNLGGVIIFTDGQVNQGLPIQEFFRNKSGIPVYVIGVGDITPMLDVFIKSVDLPPLSVKGENINIDVVISSIGNINERVNVNLFDEKNKLIGSKLITISGNEENEVIRFQIRPDKIGENNFSVKCSALSDEINIENNQQKVMLYVMKDQYNIALVTGAPSYNTSTIKHYLKSKGNNSVDHFIFNSKNFNQKIKKFLEKKYEVIIFDNNPVPSNAQKWESVARVFAKKIISHNSSFFIIPGPEIDISSLNKYLNIIDLEARELKDNLVGPMEWNFLDNWADLHSLNDKDDLLNKYQSYPPQNPAFQLIDRIDEKLDRFYANYYSDEFKGPLLVLGQKQLIRYALWNSNDFSSLKYMLSNSELDFVFDHLMRKISNWLMKKSDSSEFVFRTNKNSYQHGESVLLTGVSSDLNDNLNINEGVVELYQNKKYISSKPLFFDLNQKIYKSKFWAPKPGDIEYVIKVNKGLDSYEINSGKFKVQESHIELNKIFLNENKLIKLSKSSGGDFKNWDNKGDLIDIIKNVHKNELYVSTFTFRYSYFYVSLIIILLSFEWFYRKKNGLM